MVIMIDGVPAHEIARAAIEQGLMSTPCHKSPALLKADQEAMMKRWMEREARRKEKRKECMRRLRERNRAERAAEISPEPEDPNTSKEG